MSSQEKNEAPVGKTAAIKFGKDSGRVKVYARVRPMRPQQNSRKESIAVDVLELSSQIHVIDPRHSWEKTYNFDHVFPPESTNQEVCNALCRPLVNSALNGFNGTLMAYGQTGSGKTHTLMGPDGITSGVIDRCFKKISQDENHDFKVTMSYLQIYQEKIYDLLNSTNKVDLALREHPHKGVYVENLSEFVVRAPSEVQSLLTVGRKRLVFAETKMNRTSSRSHSVIQLKIERTSNKGKVKTDGSAKDSNASAQKEIKQGMGSPRKMKPDKRDNKDKEDEEEPEDSFAKMVSFNDDVLVRGRIYLCDLAGSERLKKTHAEGERLSEAQHINSSLLELGNVIQALADGKKTHVPFRNSTLTRLLQESLGGNCKTSLMVCVSPSMSDVSETKTTLNFGLRAMKITNTAYVNVEVDYKRLSDDLSKLLEIRDNDMAKLKDNFETRIEKMRREAEAKLTEMEAETDMALTSIGSLFESQKSDLQRDVELLQTRLEEEKGRASDFQMQLAAVDNQSKENLYRTKSILLLELISAQLYYAIRDHSEGEGFDSSVCSGDLREVTKLESKDMILENAEKLLEFFAGYLRLQSTSVKMDSPPDLSELERTLEAPQMSAISRSEASEIAVEEKASCTEDNEGSIELNKTDDDKVVETFTRIVSDDAAMEILDSVSLRGSAEKCSDTSSYLKRAESLKDGMLRIKDNLDNEALDFLKQTFNLKDATEGEPLESRREAYSRMKEFLALKDELATESATSASTLSSLEHSLCHVMFDKALQNSILVLEQAQWKNRCAELTREKEALENELRSHQKQAESLKVENNSLNKEFTQTVTVLKVVKEQKERLENEFSSVFQLYNMTDGCSQENKKNVKEKFSSLMRNNMKLKEDLSSSQQSGQALKGELQEVKCELEELKCQMKNSTNHQSTGKQAEQVFANVATQTDLVDKVDGSSTFENLFSELQREFNKLGKAANLAQSSESVGMRALRQNINGCLGENWSLTVFENEKVRRELHELKNRIKLEKENADQRRPKEDKAVTEMQKDCDVLCTGSTMAKNAGVDTLRTSETNRNGSLQFKVYDQGEIVADFEVDQNIVHCLYSQVISPGRSGESPFGQTDGDLVLPESMQSDLCNKGRDVVLKEAFKNLVKAQEANKRDKEENAYLKKRSRFFTASLGRLNSLVETEEMTQQEGSENVVLEDEGTQDIGSPFEELQNELEVKQLKNIESFIREKKQIAKMSRSCGCSNVGHGCLRRQEGDEDDERPSAGYVNSSKLGDKTEVKAPLENFGEYQKVHKINSTDYVNKVLPYPQERKWHADTEDNNLNSELINAKEKLMRLRAELTLSNTQTKNLGSQLSCLREDSSKLEAELSTMRTSPTGSKSRAPSSYDETLRLEIELAEAKERIIDLQEKLLSLHQQKAKLQSQLLSGKDEVQRMNAELDNCKVQIGMYNQEMERLKQDLDNSQGQEDFFKESVHDYSKKSHVNGDNQLLDECSQLERLTSDMNLLIQERDQLHHKLAGANDEITRLESVEDLVQQLILVENEKMNLKKRLKHCAEEPTRTERILVQRYEDDANSGEVLSTDLAEEVKRTTCENASLKSELETLVGHVVQLEEELGSVKFKLSVNETSQSKSDKKALATVLASVKLERAELKKSVGVLLSERDNLEDELAALKIEGVRLQRELAMAGIEKEEMLDELVSMRRAVSNKRKTASRSQIVLSGNLTASSNGAGNFAKRITRTGEENAVAVRDNAKSKVSSPRRAPVRAYGTMGRQDSRTEKLPLKQKNTPSPRQTTPTRTPKRGDLTLDFSKKLSRRSPRSDVTTDERTSNETRLSPIPRDIIPFDDVTITADCGDSGLARPQPNHARGIPEGKEGEKTDKQAVINSSTQELAGNALDTSSGDGVVGEVYVKTTWSLRQLFRKSHANNEVRFHATRQSRF